MSRLIRLLAALALLAAAFLSSAALAGEAPPQSVTLQQYQQNLAVLSDLLRQAGGAGADDAAALRSLQEAKSSANAVWLVNTPAGETRADLRPLAERIALAERPGTGRPTQIANAQTLLAEYQQAALTLSNPGGGAPQLLPDASRRLDLALSDARNKGRFTAWLVNLLRRLFARPQTASRQVDWDTARPYLTWGTLVLGLAGLLLMARSLIRGLYGHTGADQAQFTAGSRKGRSRPLTPEEMRAVAGQVAANGAYQEALRTLHLALLLQFDRLGLLRYQSAATNREHERVLRRHYPELARLLHPLNDLMDARLYSGQDASEADYERAVAWIEKLWREGEAASKSSGATGGAYSSASSS